MVKTDDTTVQDNYRREVLRDQSQKPMRPGSYMVGAAIAVLGAAIVALVVAVASGFGPLGSNEKATTIEWTLEQELTAIQSNRGTAQVASEIKEWTLEDELAAIRSNGNVKEMGSNDQPTTQQSGPR